MNSVSKIHKTISCKRESTRGTRGKDVRKLYLDTLMEPDTLKVNGTFGVH